MRLAGSFKRGRRLRVAKCLRQIVPNRRAGISKSSFTKCHHNVTAMLGADISSWRNEAANQVEPSTNDEGILEAAAYLSSVLPSSSSGNAIETIIVKQEAQPGRQVYKCSKCLQVSGCGRNSVQSVYRWVSVVGIVFKVFTGERVW